LLMIGLTVMVRLIGLKLIAVAMDDDTDDAVSKSVHVFILATSMVVQSFQSFRMLRHPIQGISFCF
jgi:hypothetical protein